MILRNAAGWSTECSSASEGRDPTRKPQAYANLTDKIGPYAKLADKQIDFVVDMRNHPYAKLADEICPYANLTDQMALCQVLRRENASVFHPNRGPS